MPRVKKDNTNKPCFSLRLSALLNGMLTARTTIISAPAGYGKTTAARYFLDQHLPEGAAVYHLDCLEEPVGAAWKRFGSVIQKIDTGIGNALLKIGLPDEDTKGDAACLLTELVCAEETWLVIDDFQLFQTVVPETVWNALIEYGAENLHTVILTQRPVKMRMTLKPGVLYIGREDMRLTECETGEYFAWCGVSLLPEQIRTVSRYTEGWIAALRLQLKCYMDTGSFLDTRDIHRLIGEVVWDKLTQEEQNFLLLISPFDSYTYQQAAHMLNLQEAPEYVRTLSLHNNFIFKDAHCHLFRPHSTLLEFLRSELAALPEEMRRHIFTCAGEWCGLNGQSEQAMYFFLRVGDYEKILSLEFRGMEFERTEETRVADLLQDILEHTDAEMKLRHPVSVVKIIFILFGAGRYEEFGRWCGEMSALCDGSSLPEPEKNRLSGELSLLTSFTRFNDISEMGALMRCAHELLGGRPSLIQMNDAWSFGSPSALFLYHSTPGHLDTELADMTENCSHYFALTQGHGSGGDVLMAAEAHYHRGEMENAEILAYKALYQAENKQQECVCIGAALLLGRLAVVRGNGDEFSSVLERIAGYAAQNPLKSNRMEADMAAASLMELLGAEQDIPAWLREGDISEKRLFAMSIPYAQTLFGKYMIQSGKPEIWLGMERDALALAESLRCQMAMLYGKILTAAAWQARGKMPEAVSALKEALEMALPDALYMPFAENRALFEPLLAEYCPKTEREKIFALAQKQEAGAEAVRRKRYLSSLPFGLTEREYEVAELAARGLRNQAIAQTLFVTDNTVKKHLKAIFQKMDVCSRDALQEKWKK